MCCHKRRERRGLGAVGLALAGTALNAARNNYNANNARSVQASALPHQSHGIVSLTDSVNNLALDKPQRDSNEKYTSPRNPVSIPITQDEKKNIDIFADPPSYAEISHPPSHNISVEEPYTEPQPQAEYVPRSSPPAPIADNNIALTASSPHVQAAFTALNNALTTPHNRGNKCAVKRAKRALRNNLYDAEVARREAAVGRIGCKEKKVIWRGIKQSVRLIDA